jgi:hypothetical protein
MLLVLAEAFYKGDRTRSSGLTMPRSRGRTPSSCIASSAPAVKQICSADASPTARLRAVATSR